MNLTDSLDALRSANPRRRPGFAEMATDLTRSTKRLARLDTTEPARGRAADSGRPFRRWPVIGIPAAATVIAVVVSLVAIGSPVGPLTVSPAAAMRQAVTASADAAEQSGTVEIEITQDGVLWAAKTVRWNGSDLAMTTNDPTRAGRGDLLVVDGTMYAPDPEVVDGWLELGSPASVDPDSGTTPDEYLTAVREDAGGTTFGRITAEMTDLTTSQRADGTTVYHGRVPAGALARETGIKDGQELRVLPYGYVAHDDADNPATLIDVSIAVHADGTIGEIHATWGGDASWSYRLTFRDLGSTPAPEKPSNAQPLLRASQRDAD